jgi:hypothetical protein
MNFIEPRPLADPETAACKLIELATAFEPIQDGRIYIEKINGPFLYKLKGTRRSTRPAFSARSRAVGFGYTSPEPTCG